MKYLIILGDGMADEPISAIGNKTPLQAANTPTIDKIAALGRNGLLDTIPTGYSPGSEIANLAVLGYNLDEVFEGRGALEAASAGVTVEVGEMVMRCNFICIENELIKSHSAGHITNEEARELISFLQKELGDDVFSFFPGVSYRNLVKMKGGNKQLHCTPPHDVMGVPFANVMIKSLTPEAQATADQLNALMLKSQELLRHHPVNVKRAAKGKDTANSIWLWSAGYKPNMRPLAEMFGLQRGSVISAVDLIKGIGIYAGLEVLEVEGATGLYDTNYEGKAQAALDALKTNDFVYLHIEASDEAGHEGDVPLKIKTIENLDARLVKPIYDALTTWDEPVTIAILPDHATPCAIKTHTATPIPFVIYTPGITPDEVQVYDEFAAEKGCFGLLKGDEFMKQFIANHIQ